MAKNNLVWGLHAVSHFVEQSPERVLSAYVDETRRDKRITSLVEALKVCGCHLQYGDKNELDKLAEGGRHQGAVIEVRGELSWSEDQLENLLREKAGGVLLLILDSVQDPRNLGACLRVADGAGVTAVIAPKNRAAGLTVSAGKVASGAAVPFIQVTNLARSMRKLKSQGILIIGTSDTAEETLYQANFTGPLAIVLGGEENGMRRLTREACDSLVSIPMKGQVSSLNVSVAAGVVLYEAIRQRV